MGRAPLRPQRRSLWDGGVQATLQLHSLEGGPGHRPPRKQCRWAFAGHHQAFGPAAGQDTQALAQGSRYAQRAGSEGSKNREAKKELIVPRELKGALSKNKKAAAAFERFSPSHKREYAAWISDAKRADTRQR